MALDLSIPQIAMTGLSAVTGIVTKFNSIRTNCQDHKMLTEVAEQTRPLLDVLSKSDLHCEQVKRNLNRVVEALKSANRTSQEFNSRGILSKTLQSSNISAELRQATTRLIQALSLLGASSLTASRGLHQETNSLRGKLESVSWSQNNATAVPAGPTYACHIQQPQTVTLTGPGYTYHIQQPQTVTLTAPTYACHIQQPQTVTLTAPSNAYQIQQPQSVTLAAPSNAYQIQQPQSVTLAAPSNACHIQQPQTVTLTAPSNAYQMQQPQSVTLAASSNAYQMQQPQIVTLTAPSNAYQIQQPPLLSYSGYSPNTGQYNSFIQYL